MRTAVLNLLSPGAAYALSLTVPSLSANLALAMPNRAPVAGEVMRANATTPTQLEWFTPTGGGGGGTVTSVALSAPSFLSVGGSPITGAGTLALSLATQTANLVFAAPSSGGAAAPTFRALVAADIPGLPTSQITSGTFAYSLLPVGTAANTVAAGNDSRFHNQNTDTGTNNPTFQLNNLATGVLIKNNSGVLEARTNGDAGYADFTCKNLNITGSINEVSTQTMLVSDNTFLLNSDYSGSTPTASAGLQINRSTATNGNASLLWNESAKIWSAGYLGSEIQLARIKDFTITSASFSGSTVTIAHNFGRRVCYSVWDNSTAPKEFFAEATMSADNNSLTLDFGTVAPITGTWTVTITG